MTEAVEMSFNGPKLVDAVVEKLFIIASGGKFIPLDDASDPNETLALAIAARIAFEDAIETDPQDHAPIDAVILQIRDLTYRTLEAMNRGASE